jgi:hypothetical protein
VYAAPPVTESEVFGPRARTIAPAPDTIRLQSGVARDGFLEGPSFEQDDNPYLTNSN